MTISFLLTTVADVNNLGQHWRLPPKLEKGKEHAEIIMIFWFLLTG